MAPVRPYYLLFQTFLLCCTNKLTYAFSNETVFCEICGCSFCPEGLRVGNPAGIIPVPSEFEEQAAEFGLTEVPCSLLESLGLGGSAPPELCVDALRLSEDIRGPCGCPPVPVTGAPVAAPTEPPAPAPTEPPVPAPTELPVPAPTDLPEPIPTDPPTPEPTDPQMVVIAEPDEAVLTSEPSSPPVPAPTNPPVMESVEAATEMEEIAPGEIMEELESNESMGKGGKGGKGKKGKGKRKEGSGKGKRKNKKGESGERNRRRVQRFRK